MNYSNIFKKGKFTANMLKKKNPNHETRHSSVPRTGVCSKVLTQPLTWQGLLQVKLHFSVSVHSTNAASSLVIQRKKTTGS